MGRRFLLRTQCLEEVDQVADEIAVIDHGRRDRGRTGNDLSEVALVEAERLEAGT